MSYTRGVLTTGAGDYGYVQTLSVNVDGKELIIMDETGITRVHELFDDFAEGTVVAKLNRTATVPARGDTVTLAAMPKTAWNGIYQIVSIQSEEAGEDACTLTLNIKRWLDGGIPT